MRRFHSILFVAVLSLASVAGATEFPEAPETPELTLDEVEEISDEALAPETTVSGKFVVILPEQIDRQWFWFFYTDETQHIVQSAVEKAMLDAGFEVMDVHMLKQDGGIEELMSRQSALRKASEIGADYVVIGTAVADKKSEGMAYGVTVIRASASITARMVRVADGKVLAVEEAVAEEGGQALKGASREALGKAGRDIARKLVRAAKALPAP